MARGFFFVALGELGWAEGRNVVYEWRSAQGQPQLFPSLAAELVASRVDVAPTHRKQSTSRGEGGNDHDPYRVCRGEPASRTGPCRQPEPTRGKPHGLRGCLARTHAQAARLVEAACAPRRESRGPRQPRHPTGALWGS